MHAVIIERKAGSSSLEAIRNDTPQSDVQNESKNVSAMREEEMLIVSTERQLSVLRDAD